MAPTQPQESNDLIVLLTLADDSNIHCYTSSAITTDSTSNTLQFPVAKNVPVVEGNESLRMSSTPFPFYYSQSTTLSLGVAANGAHGCHLASLGKYLSPQTVTSTGIKTPTQGSASIIQINTQVTISGNDWEKPDKQSYLAQQIPNTNTWKKIVEHPAWSNKSIEYDQFLYNDAARSQYVYNIRTGNDYPKTAYIQSAQASTFSNLNALPNVKNNRGVDLHYSVWNWPDTYKIAGLDYDSPEVTPIIITSKDAKTKRLYCFFWKSNSRFGGPLQFCHFALRATDGSLTGFDDKDKTIKPISITNVKEAFYANPGGGISVVVNAGTVWVFYTETMGWNAELSFLCCASQKIPDDGVLTEAGWTVRAGRYISNDDPTRFPFDEKLPDRPHQKIRAVNAPKTFLENNK